MNTRFNALLLTVGCIGNGYTSTATTPVSIVRAQRAEYNAAIAAHDPVRTGRVPSSVRLMRNAGAEQPRPHSPAYFDTAVLWSATHCHLPFGIFTQVSVQRSTSSNALPPSVPLPLYTPVAMAVLP